MNCSICNKQSEWPVCGECEAKGEQHQLFIEALENAAETEELYNGY